MRWLTLVVVAAALLGSAHAATTARGPDDGSVSSACDNQLLPVWSPDGREIAFDCQIGVVDSVHVVGVGNGRGRRLAAGRSPSWSPDGSRIAFATDDDGIVSINRDGSRRTVLVRTTFDSLADSPQWSPDGRYILYDGPGVGGDGGSVVRATGGTGRFLTDDGTPAWSPDSKRIAFELLVEPGRDIPPSIQHIAVVDRNGEHLHAVTKGKGWREDPAWSPDGREIAFVLKTEQFPVSKTVIWTIAAEGGKPRRVGAGTDPQFSPDGKQIAFERNNAIWTMRRDGTRQARVAAAPAKGRNWNAVWSPDGRTLAFVRAQETATGPARVWLVNRDGTHPRMLTAARRGG
jgi:Tol biopolymer transport system component